MLTLGSLVYLTPPASCRAGAGVEAEALASVRKAFAPVQRFALPNGLIGLVMEDHSAPIVSVQVWVGTGAIHEQQALGSGLCHYIEHMVFKGTPTRPVGTVARELTDAGAKFNAYTSHDRTVFFADLPVRSWRTGLDVLSDAVQHAAFPEAEWRREREVILREASMRRDNPDSVLFELLAHTAYQLHPYRVPVIGYDEVIAGVTRETLLTFFQQNYAPDNMIVVIVGDIPAAAAEAAVRERFAAAPRRARAPVLLPVEPEQVAPRVARATGAYELTRLHLAFHTVALSHADAPALELLAAIAAYGQSSRLVRELRDRLHLVHAVDAWSYTPRDAGLFGISAQCEPARERETIEALWKEVRRMTEKPCTTGELDKARRMLIVDNLHGLQSMHGQADSLATGEMYTGSPHFQELAMAQLENVTPADVQTVARRYLRAANSTLAVLAPAGAPATTGTVDVASAVPRIEVFTIKPGLRVVVREDRRWPFVSFCAALGGGVLAEGAGQAGLAHLTSELLPRGAADRSAQEIAQTVESLGGTLAPFSGYNSFGLHSHFLHRDAKSFMALFSDCLTAPSFEAGELAQQKTLQLAALDEQREQPVLVAMQALDAALYPRHPYRWTPLGRREDVGAFTKADVRRYFQAQAVTGNMVVSLFGDVSAAEARAWLTPLASRLRKASAPPRQVRANQPVLPARVEQRMPKDQAVVVLGFPGLTVRDPRTPALEMLQSALSGLSSRLSVSIRDQRGLVYYVTASQRVGLDPGVFTIYAGTHAEKADEVEQLIRAEIERVRTQGLDSNEMARAVSQLLADVDMRRQDTDALAMHAALNELYGLGADYESGVAARLAAVTPEALRAAAADLLDTNRVCVSRVLPQGKE